MSASMDMNPWLAFFVIGLSIALVLCLVLLLR